MRAFAWAPAVDDGRAAGIVGTHLSWGQSLLAIANDDNQVVLVSINSPTSTLGTQEGWSCDVLGYFAVTLEPESVILNPASFEEIVQQQRHASHLAWSPWVEIGGTSHSILVYATNMDVRARVILHASETTKYGPEVVYPDIDIRFAGPMKWSPKIENDALILVLFTNTTVICLRISKFDASILQRTTHHLDGRWDSISGVAFDTYYQPSTRLHFASLMSTGKYPTALLELTPTSLQAAKETSNWYDAIAGLTIEFSMQHDLQGNANMKIWGLSTSPLGDFLASCHTIHPTDMFEYGPPAVRSTKVNIQALVNNSKLELISRNVSAEGIIFTVKKWIENFVEMKEHIPEAKTKIQKKLLEVYSHKHDGTVIDSAMATASTSTGIHNLISAFKKEVFLNPNTVNDRYDILTSIICTPDASTDLAKTMIAFRLATSLQTLPSHLSSATMFSKTILAQSRQVLQFVQMLINDVDDVNRQSEIVEACSFCAAPIPFDSLSSASCTNGHPYTRCRLSFLSIQFPGVTKYCGVCNAPFFSDEFVVDQEEETVLSRSPTPKDDEGEMEITEGADESAQHDKDILDTREKILTSDNTIGLVSGRLIDIETTQASNTMTSGALDEGSAATRSDISTVKDGNVTLAAPKNEGDRVLPLSLARILFLACDACIYCGGKYVG